MPRPMGDRLLVGFRILDEQNKIISEIWLDPAASRANIVNFFPTGQIMESEEVSLQEFIDVITAVRDRHAARVRAYVPPRGQD